MKLNSKSKKMLNKLIVILIINNKEKKLLIKYGDKILLKKKHKLILTFNKIKYKLFNKKMNNNLLYNSLLFK